MKKELSILFISSEIAPFAKTGGLADVAGALPKVIKEMGHEIRLIMPKYGTINERKFKLREVARLKDIPIPLGDRIETVSVKSAVIPHSKVQVYFVDKKKYFDRPELYCNPETNKDWSDNAERFIFFNRAAIEILKALYWHPNIIHCNDWQSALIPLLLKTIYKNDTFFSNISTLLTIHNIAYQGIFEKEVLNLIELPEKLFYPGSGIEFWGKTNFLKVGIVYADLITTVSETYAKEIQQSEEYGYGLEGVLKDRKRDLYGIINGIDYTVWNPEIDELIPTKYSRQTLTEKKKNKKILLEANDLPFNENIPLIGIISRLADQKGFDLIEECIDDLIKLNVQIVLLGTGDEKYHILFKKIREKYPQKIGINLTFNNQLAHLIEAGSDMFLMPSRYEPCGLNQLYSLKYGTIPIVRATGGLADTIKDFDPRAGQGTGFIFEDYSSKALLSAIKRAINVFQNHRLWQKLMNNAMKQDFSWKTAAEKYVALYKKLLNKSQLT